MAQPAGDPRREAGAGARGPAGRRGGPAPGRGAEEPLKARAPEILAAEALDLGRSALALCGVPEPRANAEFLLAAVLGAGRADLAAGPGRPVDPRRLRVYRGLLRRRGRRVPLAYVLGTQPFCGIELRVTPAVLIPRPETEELVEAALAALRAAGMAGRRLAVLDIGTGSGCAALALAMALPSAAVTGTDVSVEALAVARENARRLGLADRARFVREDLFRPGRLRIEDEVDAGPGPARQRSWDVVISNPPYIPSGRLKSLAPEVRREPRLALDGGADGLVAVRAVVRLGAARLAAGGLLAIEIDDGQGGEARALLSSAGLSGIEVGRDSRGLERFALGWK